MVIHSTTQLQRHCIAWINFQVIQRHRQITIKNMQPSIYFNSLVTLYQFFYINRNLRCHFRDCIVVAEKCMCCIVVFTGDLVASFCTTDVDVERIGKIDEGINDRKMTASTLKEIMEMLYSRYLVVCRYCEDCPCFQT